MAVRRTQVGPRDAWLAERLSELDTTDAPPHPYTDLAQRQREVIDSQARFVSLLCGRRAGKTDCIDRNLATILGSAAETENLFVALTTESAKTNMWRPLQRIDRKYRLGLKFDHARMTVSHPKSRAVLQVRGSETLRDLEKPRGGGYYAVRLDECGAWRPTYLEYFLDDVIGPALMDHEDSTLWLAGTPGRVAVGPFYDASAGTSQGFRRFGWTAWDNPHINADAFVFGPCRECAAHPDVAALRTFEGLNGEPRLGCVHGLLGRKNWTVNTPQFRREYLAIWILDESSLVYRFSPTRNVIAELPALVPGDSWCVAIGMDFGVTHATAVYTLVWPKRYGRAVYVVRGFSAPGLAASDLVALLEKERERCVKEFGKVEYLIGDPGGGGKVYHAEWNKRHPHVAWAMAQKTDKRGALDHISDALMHASSAGDITQHTGLLTLASNSVLHRQWQTLQWDEDRKDIAEGQDDDDADAVMYAWRFSPAFANASRPPAEEKRILMPWQSHLPRPESPLERAFRGHVRGRGK